MTADALRKIATGLRGAAELTSILVGTAAATLCALLPNDEGDEDNDDLLPSEQREIELAAEPFVDAASEQTTRIALAGAATALVLARGEDIADLSVPELRSAMLTMLADAQRAFHRNQTALESRQRAMTTKAKKVLN